eukprot:6437444-Alexandrium_andersonii.AAC.1
MCIRDRVIDVLSSVEAGADTMAHGHESRTPQERPRALADREWNAQGHDGDLRDHVLPWEEPEFPGSGGNFDRAAPWLEATMEGRMQENGH